MAVDAPACCRRPPIISAYREFGMVTSSDTEEAANTAHFWATEARYHEPCVGSFPNDGAVDTICDHEPARGAQDRVSFAARKGVQLRE